jgi:sugar phosphate isomerase/epimerase
MNPSSNWSRRDFLRVTAQAAPGTALWGRRLVIRVTPQIGVCRDLKDAVAMKAAGYDYLECNVGSLLVPDKPEAEFEQKLARLKASSLPVSACAGFLPGNLKIVGPQADHDAAAKYAETALRRAGVANIKTIVFGSGGARKIPDDFDPVKAREQFIAFAKRIAPVAEQADVILVLEALNRKECNFINTITEGAAIVDAVAHPAFMLHVDIYHMLQEDEPPEAIIKAGGRIHHVHVAQRGTRAAPLPGGTDFRPYFKALKSLGYCRRISLECKWGKNANEFAAAYACVRKQWAEA